MRTVRFAFLAATALLAACTPMEWVRKDAGPEQLRQDQVECQRQAWREAQWRGFMARPYGPLVLTDPTGRRHIWPHSLLGDPFGDQFMEESRLANFCMRARGWELTPVEKAEKPKT